MRVLLDSNVNRRFAQLIYEHEIVNAQMLGLNELENGDLIAVAEDDGFDAVITCDKNIRYPQNLGGRKISIIVLNSLLIKLKSIRPLAPQVNEALSLLEPAAFVVISPLPANCQS